MRGKALGSDTDERKCSEFVDTTDNLEKRMEVNTRYGDNNLETWVTRHLAVKKGERILDLGCGTGTYLKRLAGAVGEDGRCVGVDRDAGTIAKALLMNKARGPSIRFLILDMDEINDAVSPLRDDIFDLIYSVYAFYYSKEEFKLLDTLSTKLTPKGRISIVGPYGDNNKDWFAFLGRFMRLPPAIVASSNSFMNGVEKYARKNFGSVRTQEFVNNITVPSVDALRGYWKSNIYYESGYDSEFERSARKLFAKQDAFRFCKKALMITMKNPKNTPSSVHEVST